MNKEQFLKSLQKKELNYTEIFDKLYQGVIDTNKMIGLCPKGLDSDELETLTRTYHKLRMEEGKEIFTAIENFDKVEYLDGLIDLLVVAGYEDYLHTGKKRVHYYINGGDLDYVEGYLDNPTTAACELVLENVESILIDLDINLEQAVDTVLQSNLSKFPTHEDLSEGYALSNTEVDLQCLIAWQCNHIEAAGRYTGVHCKKVVDSEGEERLTFWATHDKGEEKLKYVKPVTFSEPDFYSCWNV